MSRMPQMDGLIPEGEDPEEALKRIQGIIDSMTKEERRNPDIIDISRRRRIAAGSGTEPHEIKQLLQQFEMARTMMRQMAKMSMWEKVKAFSSLNKMGAFAPGAKMFKPKVGTGHRKSAKERAEDRKRKRKQERRGKRKDNPDKP
jgi:signal recognition particle subunit SRP54